MITMLTLMLISNILTFLLKYLPSESAGVKYTVPNNYLSLKHDVGSTRMCHSDLRRKAISDIHRVGTQELFHTRENMNSNKIN